VPDFLRTSQLRNRSVISSSDPANESTIGNSLWKWYIKEEVPKVVDMHGGIAQQLLATEINKNVLQPKYNTALNKELL
jgi:hypothetical protein